MWQVRSSTRPRRYRSWLVAIALVPVVVLGVSACTAESATPGENVITNKGTPFHDLLVPKLQASVTDGQVGVAVDQPVTVSAGDGVLGAVSLVKADGSPVEGKLSRDGLTWSTDEPLGYNKQYTLNADAMGLGGMTHQHLSFRTHSPDNLTMAYASPKEGEVVVSVSHWRSGSTRTFPIVLPPSVRSR